MKGGRGGESQNGLVLQGRHRLKVFKWSPLIDRSVPFSFFWTTNVFVTVFVRYSQRFPPFFLTYTYNNTYLGQQHRFETRCFCGKITNASSLCKHTHYVFYQRD